MVSSEQAGGTGEKLSCLGLSLARCLQEEPKRGSFRALFSISRCSAFPLSGSASFLLLQCSLPFSTAPQPAGHHSDVHLPLGMPGQALIDFFFKKHLQDRCQCLKHPFRFCREKTLAASRGPLHHPKLRPAPASHCSCECRGLGDALTPQAVSDKLLLRGHNHP